MLLSTFYISIVIVLYTSAYEIPEVAENLHFPFATALYKTYMNLSNSSLKYKPEINIQLECIPIWLCIMWTQLLHRAVTNLVVLYRMIYHCVAFNNFNLKIDKCQVKKKNLLIFNVLPNNRQKPKWYYSIIMSVNRYMMYFNENNFFWK